MPPAKKKSAKKSASEMPVSVRPAPDGWSWIASIVPLPDGRVFAGSHDGQGAACLWNADASLAWTTSIPTTKCSLDLDVSSERVFVYARESRTAWSLHPDTGAILERHDLAMDYGFVCRKLRMSPDGRHVVARVSTEAELFALPGFTHVAKLPQYANEAAIAFSSDGARAAVTGHEVHIYELATRACIATWRPPSPPYHMAFTPSGRLATADGVCGVALFEPDGTLVVTHDAMPERKKKQALRHLAASDSHIAAVRDDGELVVWMQDREVKRLSKLAPTAIALTDVLWVGTSELATYAL